MNPPWTYWIRRLHDSDQGTCELFVLREGDRPGWDDHYVTTYWNYAEADAAGHRLLAAPRNQPVDAGHGITMILPN